MAIVVKHSGNAAPALVGAYGGGQGKRQAEDARQAAAIAAAAKQAEEQRQFQAREAYLSRQQQTRLSREAFGERRTAAQQEMDFRRESQASTQDFQREMDQTRSDLITGRDEQHRDWAVEDREFETLRRRDDIEWGYTAKTKAESETLANALHEIDTADYLTDAERGPARKEALQRFAGLQMTPRIAEVGGWKQGEIREQGGLILSMGKDGEIQKLGESKKSGTGAVMDREQHAKLWDAATKIAQGDSETPVGPDKIQKVLDAMDADYRRRTSGEASPAETEPQASGSQFETLQEFIEAFKDDPSNKEKRPPTFQEISIAKQKKVYRRAR